jgi:hypothetical protein
MSESKEPGSGCGWCERLLANCRSSAKPLKEPFTMSEMMLAASWTLSSGPACANNLLAASPAAASARSVPSPPQWCYL